MKQRRLRDAAILFASGIASLACIDPLVSDEVERPELILPKDTELPMLTDSPIARAAIDRHDGIDGDRLRLQSGFANGERVWYWDLGEASPAPIPLYVLAEPAEQGSYQTPQGRFGRVVGTKSIFDAVPGDPGYSPWWTTVVWPVTSKYRGEVIASFEAMDEALRQGLVGPPMTLARALNCPVVLPEARLEIDPDDPTALDEPRTAYYRGKVVTYFGFDAIPVDTPTVSTPPVYVLRREGGEPVSEPLRGVDMTRDGDLLDTNDIFAAGLDDDAYSGMVELVDAIVVDGEYIDRSQSDDESELTDAALLFSGTMPNPERVIALRPQGTIVNRPLWAPEDP